MPLRQLQRKLHVVFSIITMILTFAISNVYATEHPHKNQSNLAPSHLDLPIYAEGKLTSLGALAQGRPSLLIFWAVDCQFCKKEISSINKLHEQFHETALILAVNNDQDYSAFSRIPNYIEQHGLQAHVVQDPKGFIGRRFNIPGTPTAVLIDQQGRLVKKTHAHLHKLEGALNQLIQQDG